MQIGPDPLQAPTGVLGPELALWRLVLKNGLWLLSFLWLPPLLSGPGALWHLERVYSHPVLLVSALAIVDRITAATMLMLIQLLVKMMAMMTSVYILGEV